MQERGLPGVIDCHHQTFAEVLKDLRLVSCIDHAALKQCRSCEAPEIVLARHEEGTVDPTSANSFSYTTRQDRSVKSMVIRC